jgi:hypothetical protein
MIGFSFHLSGSAGPVLGWDSDLAGFPCSPLSILCPLRWESLWSQGYEREFVFADYYQPLCSGKRRRLLHYWGSPLLRWEIRILKSY